MWNLRPHNIGLIIWIILVEGHKMMLHAKYESSKPYGMGQEGF